LGGCLFWAGFFKFTEEAQIIGLLFSHSKRYVLILTKHGLGYILGDLFTNSSGHPVGWLSERVAAKTVT
jgi:hypothetical protein